VKIINDTHNHPPSKTLADIPGARRLTDEQQQTVIDMCKGGASPSVILSTLKVSDPTILATPHDIYNIKQKFCNEILQHRTSLEALLDKLQTEGVYHAYQRNSEGSLTCLFIAPEVCVLNAQEIATCDVLLMDSTYKTNK
jgi:hypothetical protein